MSCGKISTCAEKNCKFKCCDFDQGNYILLFPGELDEAIKNNQNVSHLKVIEQDDMNGHKVICTASQKQNCDNGYKPLDCLFYPFFPIDINEEKIIVHKGIKCPLNTNDIQGHVKFVANEVQIHIKRNEVISKWLEDVKLIGYEKIELNIK